MSARGRVACACALALFACSTQPASRSAPAPKLVPSAPVATPPSPAPAAVAAPVEPEPPEPAPLRFGPLGVPQDTAVALLARAEVLSLKPLGARAVLFRSKLGQGFDAALKVASRDRPLGPQAEVVAYAIARCLGLQTVPPAVMRLLPLDTLRNKLDPSASAMWPEIAARVQTSSRGSVQGAFIYWIADLSDIGLDRNAGLTRARDQLRVGAKLEKADRQVAAQLSGMLDFDYLIGNYDRWSGGNVKGSKDRSWLYVRDHDIALPARLGDTTHARLVQQMQLAQRVSRELYTRARALTAGQIEREAGALGVDPSGLLSVQIAGVLDRRDAFVSYVQALIEEHGEAAVLFFD